jgi:hypothetical protein
MVDITKAFYDLLQAQTPVTDIVGNRIYTDAPAQTMVPPALIFWTVSDRVWASLKSATEIALEQTTFQVDCYGMTRTEANNLAYEVWRAIDGFAGQQNEVLILDLSRSESGITHEWDPVSGGTDQRRFISSQDFDVTFDCVNTYA